MIVIIYKSGYIVNKKIGWWYCVLKVKLVSGGDFIYLAGASAQTL